MALLSDYKGDYPVIVIALVLDVIFLPFLFEPVMTSLKDIFKVLLSKLKMPCPLIGIDLTFFHEWQLDVWIVLLYTILLVLRVIMYPVDLCHWYRGTYASADTLSTKHFFYCMEILLNKKDHLERPLARNFTFDAIRCLSF